MAVARPAGNDCGFFVSTRFAKTGIMETPEDNETDLEKQTLSRGVAAHTHFEQNEFGETMTYRTVIQADASTGQPETPLPMPEKIGRYETRGVLGQGAYGAVYQGYDPQLGRRVAIKVPLLRVTGPLEKMLLHEARHLAQLTHPNIVTVHDVGVDGGLCYIVSEFLEGQNLNHWLRERTLRWQEAAEIVAALADGLALAHARGTIHRDVKPANVIMTQRGESVVPVLVDFGLAVSESSEEPIYSQRGLIVGTLNYMSPEQARGEGHRIDGRTDIYALGIILYRLLSGRLPFTAATAVELLQVVLRDEARPLRQFVPGLPSEVERICLKAMAKQIVDRYTTAGDLAGDLRQLLRGPVPAQPKTPVVPRAQDKPAKRDPAKILIADDQELIRFKLQTDLQKWGHEVTAAEDGEQAWELFQQGDFSIVITDWMMPHVDGLELVRRIRASRTENYVYVVMLTAKAEKHDIVAGMGAGADDFLAKPFHRDELQLRVRAGIRITNLYRELNETNRRLQRSHDAFVQIQRSFLPTSKPDLAGFQFAWQHRPCGGLGGDMLNIVRLGETQLGLYVLDVTGGGVPAALLAATLGRVLTPATDSASLLVERDAAGSATRVREPVEVLGELARRFGKQEGKQFFTLVYGLLNLETRAFRFASAAHVPVLHQRAKQSPAMLDVDGFPIGIGTDGIEFQQRPVALAAGDRLLLYSDGLTDAMNADGEVFGAARLIERVKELGRQPLDDMVRLLLEELSRWCGNPDFKDDASILAVEVL
jgi:sigma-B regulation protein RsbU (phosphoserine phosphatase)